MRRSQRQDDVRIGAVILAAGRSRRMGRPKLLLPWGSTSILGHLVERWISLGAEQIGVVYAPDDAALPQEFDRIGFPLHDRIENPNPDTGMFSSIQCAARWFGWRPTLTHWALILGDQPHLRVETLRALLALVSEQPQQVVQPTYAGHRRHPALLPRTIFLRLRDSNAVNLREFLAQYTVALTPCDDSGLDLDIDRPEDYNRALQLQAGRPSSA